MLFSSVSRICVALKHNTTIHNNLDGACRQQISTNFKGEKCNEVAYMINNCMPVPRMAPSKDEYGGHLQSSP